MEIYFKDAASMEAFKKIATQEILNTAKIGVWLPQLTLTQPATTATAVEDEDEDNDEAAVVNDTVPEQPLRSDNDADIRKVMKEMRMNWEDAWTFIRCMELEDGASICCSEECEGHSSAMDELVESAQIGKKKRNARRRAMGRATSDDEGENEDNEDEDEDEDEDNDDEDEDEDNEETKAYVPPPRIRDAEYYWPYARCKNIVQEIMGAHKTIPRSHFELLTYIAGLKGVSLDELKKTNPFNYFKDDKRVAKTLSALSYKGMCHSY